MDDPSRQLVLSLHRATALVDRVADAYLRPAHGITVSMFSALVTIEAIGPARQSEIARGLDVSRAAVSQRLVELVSRGYAEVTADAADQRANRVALTPTGRALLADAWRGLAASDDGLERNLDLPALQHALDTLIANAARHLDSLASRDAAETRSGRQARA
ncbi:MarR family winged helix-turn-helix transcriptional regulator [Microcella daejeonensis]|uniref:MarR family winged helix-turn-helix transcriptional regulator n=1 Tax=Microcella daejeonensis TaxID=2994971 RepID=A0A9E8S9B9_9MICO|nr:MarR family winged helix-turn-helix transcriptional regulator [Microcella daejeonensis]WAB82505.1 MarR family winged helix-turn-helix transcriptional regulator [Microcella daejeonensis]